jgi:hypothetical protein
MKYLATLILLFSLCSYATAQSDIAGQYNHQLGMHAGTTTGVGLSYRYWPGRIGFQVTLLPYKNNAERKDNAETTGFGPFSDIELPRGQFISLGLTGLTDIKQFGRSSMFAYWGNHLLLLDDHSVYSTGIGIGFTYEAPVSFNLMAGYGAYDITNSLVLFPAAEIGLYYRFRSKK